MWNLNPFIRFKVKFHLLSKLFKALINGLKIRKQFNPRIVALTM